MSEWQPIETAPKDGTSILVWDGWSVGIVAWVMSLSEAGGWWRYQAGPNAAAFDDDEPTPICDTPTHWMPLPAPP